MGKKPAKTTDVKKVAYDYAAHTIISASTTRPCLDCGRNSVHKKDSCKDAQ